VLGVGIDWSEEFHLVALGRPDEGVIEVRRVDHSRAGVSALLATSPSSSRMRLQSGW
jgi:hypothetical protein